MILIGNESEHVGSDRSVINPASRVINNRDASVKRKVVRTH